MKQLYNVMKLCLILVSIGTAQRTFAIDYSASMENIKDLVNVNGGPNRSVAGYVDAGVHLVRTHDFNGAVSDYINYSQFWKNGNINPSFNPTDPTHYQWLYSDAKIDSVVQFGMKPYFRLGVSYSYIKDTLFIRPPYDLSGPTFSNFAEVCKRTVMHYNAGWAKGFFHGIKYWEIWNEPDGGFWRADSVSFYKMFKETSDSLNRYDPNLMVGGPGVLSGSIVSKRPWVSAFLKYGKENNTPMDFFSWHLYGQHNPYAVAIWGEYVRSLLDSYGFTNTKSIISEFNIDLGQTNNPDLNSPKGAAYIASSLISAQFSSVDNILLYRGEGIMNMLEADSAGLPKYTWNGLGMKAFSILYHTAPIRISASGSVYVSGEQFAKKDTTNIMVLAGRSEDRKKCTVVISNYDSKEGSFSIALSHLPWTSPGNVSIRKNVITAMGDRFTETESSIPGSASLNLTLSSVAAPSVVVLQLTYSGEVTSVEQNDQQPHSFELFQNYPNPFNPSTSINFTLQSTAFTTLKVYDVLGREVTTLVQESLDAGVYYQRIFDAHQLASGMYVAVLKSGTEFKVMKMSLMK
jgi:hypothetical protein